MKRAAFIFVLALFVFGATFSVARMTASVLEDRQLNYGESTVLWQASQLHDLKNAFRPIEQFPHMVFNYTPVYHITVNGLNKLVGNALLSGRLVSMAAALWLVGVLSWTVIRATRGHASVGIRLCGAVFTCAYALQLPSMAWVPLVRVDILGLAMQFTALSFLCTRRFLLREQAIVFCLLLLGVYTKQSLLAVPAASILLLGLVRPARAVQLAAGFTLTGLAVLLAFVWATDGGAFRHWVSYNVNPFSAAHAISKEIFASDNLAPLVGAGFGAFWLIFPKRRMQAHLMSSQLRRVCTGFGLAVMFGFILSLGIGKEGADINYCLDWQLALCPLAGIFAVFFLKRWEKQGQAKDDTVALLPVFTILVLAVTALLLVRDSALAANAALGFDAGARHKLATNRREDAELVELLARLPGPVVSENMMLLLRAGKYIPFEASTIKAITETGLFDEGPLVQKTVDRFFDAFILEPNSIHFTPRMLEAIGQNYRRYPFDGPDYIVYVR